MSVTLNTARAAAQPGNQPGSARGASSERAAGFAAALQETHRESARSTTAGHDATDRRPEPSTNGRVAAPAPTASQKKGGSPAAHSAGAGGRPGEAVLKARAAPANPTAGSAAALTVTPGDKSKSHAQAASAADTAADVTCDAPASPPADLPGAAPGFAWPAFPRDTAAKTIGSAIAADQVASLPASATVSAATDAADPAESVPGGAGVTAPAGQSTAAVAPVLGTPVPVTPPATASPAATAATGAPAVSAAAVGASPMLAAAGAPTGRPASAQASTVQAVAAGADAVAAAPPVTAAPAAGAPATTRTEFLVRPTGSAKAEAVTVVQADSASSTANGAASALPVAAAATPAAPVAAAAPLASAAPVMPVPLMTQVAKPLFTLSGVKPGEHVLTINVTPDNLGPLTVRAHVTGDNIRVELFAPTDLARDALRAILPDLRRDLAGGGVNAQLDLSSQSQASDARADAQAGRQQRPPPGIRDGPGGGPSDDPPSPTSPRRFLSHSSSTIDVMA